MKRGPLIGGLASSPATSPTAQLLTGLGVAAGCGVLIYVSRVEAPDGLTHGQFMLMEGVLGATALLGAAIAAGAWRTLMRASAVVAAGTDGWRLDRDWTPGESRDGARAQSGVAAWRAALLVAYAAFLIGVPGMVLELPDAVLAGAGALALWLAWTIFGSEVERGLRQGDSVLRWEGATPVRPGTDWSGTVEVRVRLTAPKAWLRLVSETPLDDDEYARVDRREAAHVDARAAALPDGRVAVRLDIPADAASSGWTKRPCRYWELVVRDEKAGFEAAFPFPLY